MVDIFTQFMQKDSLEKLGGKPKSITHLNWSRSLINVVPIQTESCLKTTTFVDINYHVRVDFLWNRWKTMVSLIDWKNCVISCFSSPLMEFLDLLEVRIVVILCGSVVIVILFRSD